MDNVDYTEEYKDIINMTHPDPKNHVRMKVEDRAAQFAAFAALSGHDEEIAKTAEEYLENFENL